MLQLLLLQPKRRSRPRQTLAWTRYRRALRCLKGIQAYREVSGGSLLIVLTTPAMEILERLVIDRTHVMVGVTWWRKWSC